MNKYNNYTDFIPPILLQSLKTVKKKLAGKHKLYHITENFEGNRIIFIHIHKCAGTSFWNTFNNQANFVFCVPRPGRFKHGLGKELIDMKIWNESFKFTFVRNPYDRIVSAYKMFMRNKHNWTSVFENFEDFVEFIRWSDVDNHHVDKVVATEDYVQKTGNIIHHCSSYHNPKYHIGELDFIGKLENLSEDMKKLRLLYQLSDIELKKTNTTKITDYRNYYNVDTRKIIHKKYEKDIEIFKYSF